MKRLAAAVTAVLCAAALAACQPKREAVECTVDGEPVVALLAQDAELRYRGSVDGCIRAEFTATVAADDIFQRYAVRMASLGWHYVAEAPNGRTFCRDAAPGPSHSVTMFVTPLGVMTMSIDPSCSVPSDRQAPVAQQWPLLWGRALSGQGANARVRPIALDGVVVTSGGGNTGPADIGGYGADGLRSWFEEVPAAVLREAANAHMVFLHLSNGMLVGLDGATGRLRWIVTEPAFADAAQFAADADHVYAVESSGFLVALDAADGKVAWRVPAGSAYAGPVVAGGLVITAGTAVTAYQASSGRRLWTSSTDLPVADALGADGESVFACSSAAHVGYAVSAKTGKLRWRTRFEECGPAMTPAGGAVYTVGRNLTGVDARSGRVLWPPVPVVIAQTPTVDGNVILVHDQNGYVVGVSAHSGQFVWRSVQTLVRPGDPDLTAADHVVYAIGDSSILAYDLRPPVVGR
jgi:outer membrane protein assembly factor BamB